MIKLQGVTKRFQDKTALDGFSADLAAGSITGLIGPNGAGKTTLIRLLNGLLLPEEGSIAVDGLSPEKDGDEVRRSCGTLTEQPGLYDDMTGRENLRFYASLYGIHGLDRIQELSGVLSLQEFLDRKTGTYSTGMKKRLGLARAMLHKPSVLLLDEPTNGLDPDGTRDVLLYLKRLNEHEGVTVLICSHVLSQLETVCSSYIFLEQGAKKAEGTLQELRKRYISTLQLEIRVRDWQGRNGNIQIEAESYEALPGLLRSISAQSRLYEARILNDDLQSIYFQIRKENLP
ncbi:MULTISPECIES: ABC transporter ATP-binding protein [unclassified Paenibacillus]|uniref:ABC transporter ATP-binding protein n=1 Tax=unclassified Paenibacillus TaxID=185978 RepID=UPI000956D91A|nr:MULTISPECIES: ABC transporter ATP-binding protein [unclassified Paenibacillus]ASS66063.1 ABC transporter ATP-binding protein [Paenibacillus sp. RUD330]SIQ13728.1 ABC-2 type transport system ATP-binding protein [Paenibacillus sp. RU4X]SIQ35554.1 ABC-2 type transport system ATP-binding protein [Paenibacillus sp. RU4T]